MSCDTSRKTALRKPSEEFRLLMSPPCSTTNRRPMSPGGTVKKTGAVRTEESGWSRRVFAGAGDGGGEEGEEEGGEEVPPPPLSLPLHVAIDSATPTRVRRKDMRQAKSIRFNLGRFPF